MQTNSVFTEETEKPTDKPRGRRLGDEEGREPISRSVRHPGQAKTRTGPTPTKPKRKPASGKPDYRPAVKGILQVPAAVLLFTAQRTKSGVLYADAIAVGIHTEPIAEALNDLAQQDEKIAAALEFLSTVGPYGALLTAVTPLIAQIATNHGAPVAVTSTFGAVSPQELLIQAGIATAPSPNESKPNEPADATV